LSLDYDCQIWFPNWAEGERPKFKEHGYISSESEYEKIRPFLFQPDKIRAMHGHLEGVRREYEEQGDITWITLGGFFWFPCELFGIEDHLFRFYDYLGLYHRICRDMRNTIFLLSRNFPNTYRRSS
jgi:hypothetical protein